MPCRIEGARRGAWGWWILSAPLGLHCSIDARSPGAIGPEGPGVGVAGSAGAAGVAPGAGAAGSAGASGLIGPSAGGAGLGSAGTGSGELGVAGAPPLTGAASEAGAALGCQYWELGCSGACVDATSDIANCGACGAACAAPRGCEVGYCAEPRADLDTGSFDVEDVSFDATTTGQSLVTWVRSAQTGQYVTQTSESLRFATRATPDAPWQYGELDTGSYDTLVLYSHGQLLRDDGSARVLWFKDFTLYESARAAGQGFSAPREVPVGASTTTPLALAQSGAAVLLAVSSNFLDGRAVQLSRLDPATDSWSLPIDLDTAGRQAVLGSDAQGNALAAWLGGGSSDVRVARYTAATDTWSAYQSLTPPLDLDQDAVLHLAVSRTGVGLLGWADGGIVGAATFEPQGARWSVAGPAPSVSDAQLLDVAVDDQGYGFVLLKREPAEPPGELVVARLDPARGWSAPRALPFTTASATGAELVGRGSARLGGDGLGAIVWDAEQWLPGKPARSNIVGARRYDARTDTWGELQIIEGITPKTFPVGLFVAAQGSLVLA